MQIPNRALELLIRYASQSCRTAALLVLGVLLTSGRLLAQAAAPTLPDPAGLELHGNFTLTYNVLIKDTRSVAMIRRQFDEMRADYKKLLAGDPHFCPVPDEYYKPFAQFLAARTKLRHVVLIASERDGKLLWRQREGHDTTTLVYNGRNGTRRFWNGHAGRIEAGLRFDEMSDCPLPAVGLPNIPLFKSPRFTDASGKTQTWSALCIQHNCVESGNSGIPYLPGKLRLVPIGSGWKVMEIASVGETQQYFAHRRFQNLWIASRMRTTRWELNEEARTLPQGLSPEETTAWVDSHIVPSATCDYCLVSASNDPLPAREFGP
ncbi:MAG: hypothetical protein P4L33_22010 [Capsulimonadaceae bacterium]|nr:hypothetical protein [Capsulimonadaceae bacterium]